MKKQREKSTTKNIKRAKTKDKRKKKETNYNKL